MGKVSLLIELLLRSIFPPFYSFSMVEHTCIKKLKRDPKDKNALWVLANLYENYKQFEKAKILLEQLYKMGKRSKSEILLLSRVYYNLYDYEKVKEVLLDNTTLLPKDVENYYLGDSLIHLKEFEKATSFLSIYVKYHKNKYEPFFKLGYAYYMRHLFDNAMDAFREAEKIAPMNSEIKKFVELCRKKQMALNDQISIA